MTLKELDAFLALFKKHGAIAAEFDGVKVQFGPAAFEGSLPAPTPPPDVIRKEPDPEAVMAELHLGGGRG